MGIDFSKIDDTKTKGRGILESYTNKTWLEKHSNKLFWILSLMVVFLISHSDSWRISCVA